MAIWEIVLEYLKVIVSFPTAIIIVVFLFFKPIKDLIPKIESLEIEKVKLFLSKQKLMAASTMDITSLDKTEDDLREELQNAAMKYMFEQFYNISFLSQIEFLEYLRRGPADYNMLERFYKKAVQLGLEESNATYHGFYNSLMSLNLISQEETYFKITGKGKEFLEYIKKYHPDYQTDRPL